MKLWLKIEFVLCVLFPIVFAPFNYYVLRGNLIGSLYGLGLIPVFVSDYFHDKKKA